MSQLMSGMADKGKDFLEDMFAFKVENVVKVDPPENAEAHLLQVEYSDEDHPGHSPTPRKPQQEEESAEETSCLTISVYSAVVIALICTFLVLGRDYIKYVLMSMEETDLWISFFIFTCMFTVVSFPMTWGYILFNIAAGYLYGFRMGLVTVMVCALTGLSIAHFVIKRFLSEFVQRKLTNNTVRAIMRVIESGHGFRVVILSRLTPIPFGLQNAIFAISNISFSRYICASALGMAPSQGMHAYIGSTLRSMEEVISGGSADNTMAYVVFAAQLSMVAVLLAYIIRRARRELNRTVQELDSHAPPPPGSPGSPRSSPSLTPARSPADAKTVLIDMDGVSADDPSYPTKSAANGTAAIHPLLKKS